MDKIEDIISIAKWYDDTDYVDLDDSE